MTSLPLRSLTLGVVAGLLLVSASSQPVLSPTHAAPPGQYIGATSCSGGSCHGGEAPKSERAGTEYSTWQSKDPHSKSHQTLYSELATEITEAYNEESSRKIKEAASDPRCLRCHSTYVPDKARQGGKYSLEDGVSCEQCHGPAGNWYRKHPKDGVTYQSLLPLGMRNFRDLKVRAQICLECHLGQDPALLDAGHPDLSFELFSWVQRQNPHWYERQPWDGARSWLIGLCMSLDKALTLLTKAKEPSREDLALKAELCLSYLLGLELAVPKLGNAAIKGHFAKADAFAVFNQLRAEKKVEAGLLKAHCATLQTLIKAFAAELSAAKTMDKSSLRALWKALLALDTSRFNEYDAEQVSGGVWALYQSLSQGAGPRLAKKAPAPEAIKRLQIRVSAATPEDLFDDDGYFKGKLYGQRLKKVAALIK